MTKNTASRDLKIYMEPHSTPIYLSTKLNGNYPKYRGVMVICSSLFKGKMHLWQYGQKYSQKHATKKYNQKV